MEFKDKIALVTGAASGIGKATAIALASEGAYVIAADLNEEGGERTVAEIRSAGSLGKFTKVNVASYEEVKKLMKYIKTKFGRLDIAVNNAGIAGANARTVDYPLDDWSKVMEVNASSVFYCMKEQIPIMMSCVCGQQTCCCRHDQNCSDGVCTSQCAHQCHLSCFYSNSIV